MSNATKPTSSPAIIAAKRSVKNSLETLRSASLQFRSERANDKTHKKSKKTNQK